jgi:hypothetical protein
MASPEWKATVHPVTWSLREQGAGTQNVHLVHSAQGTRGARQLGPELRTRDQGAPGRRDAPQGTSCTRAAPGRASWAQSCAQAPGARVH